MEKQFVKRSKRIFALVIALSMLLSLTACGSGEYDPYGKQGHTEERQKVDHPGKTSSSSAGKPSASADISRYFSDGAIREKRVQPKGNGQDTVTILVFMNGSNLESDDAEATSDLSEMVAAGSSDKVNIIVQTMGTKKWDKKFGIASDRSQIYKVNGDGLTLLKDDIGQKDCTAEKTLSDFIIWGAQNYPADRYILLFWDHGGGPVYGFGYDEWVNDEDAALTIDEMQRALKTAGVYFDFVGMDCCLMSCLEVCCAFYDYCDYMVLSEDFESSLGWSYTNWLRTLYQNTSIPTVDLGKIISDDMVSANEDDTTDGDNSIMAVIDMSMLKVLYTAWTDFAYDTESALLGNNYSRSIRRNVGGRVLPALAKKERPWNWNFVGKDDDEEDDATMAEYFVTDIMEVASSINSEKSGALSAAINAALVYVKSTKSNAGLTGIAVSLPYGDAEYYQSLQEIFTGIGLDDTYVDWLEKFVSSNAVTGSGSHDSWDEYWDGWDNYDEEYDWDDWDYADDSYGDDWWDGFGWDSWDFDDSWNQWYDDDDWDDDGDYHGDHWYYEEDYRHDEEWYGGHWGGHHGYYDDYDDDYDYYDDYEDYDEDDSFGWFW